MEEWFVEAGILRACGFECWMGALCGYGFEDWWLYCVVVLVSCLEQYREVKCEGALWV